MQVNVLIADDDMDVNQLVHDVLEICFRDVKVERAMSLGSFWAKLPAAGDPWDLIFLSAEYIKEEPGGFAGRVLAANPAAPGKVIVVGGKPDFEAFGDDVKRFPFLAKPFSLDEFEEVVRGVQGQ
ncbi:MAG: hypothetical protein LBH93_06530 [Chitinispirillales bacterium]|jgi:DNA-binding NtrC family response regulator|nr:hypothetical protein [Chitinispirillales bacterium]